MHYITPLIQSTNQGLQKTAMSLMGNLSRTSILQLSLARQLLPDLATRLSGGVKGMGKCDDTIAATCYTVRSLLPVDPEVSKKIITNELVTALTDISENENYPKGGKATALLLYHMAREEFTGDSKKVGDGQGSVRQRRYHSSTQVSTGHRMSRHHHHYTQRYCGGCTRAMRSAFIHHVSLLKVPVNYGPS